MKHILALTDFSGRSALALERALDLAKLSNARVTTLNVIDEDQPASMIAAHEREAKALFSQMAERPNVERLVRIGEPFVAISQCADELGADLLVFGARRRAPLRNAFVGTTAERALRRSRIPALIVNRGAEGKYKRPVAALDLVDNDLFPWRAAARLDLVEPQNAKVVFAYEAGSFHDLRKANRDVKGFEGYFQSEREGVLPSVAAAMKELGLRADQAELHSIYYSPAQTILDAAKRCEADLIVIGSRRQSALARYMLGSVSAEVLQSAEMDVLVVPPA
ncbi:MAG: universal stress protein [Parvularculaceae bacterium]|jgi:nucleotide-binding universal stress UspA family protein|nr:universal stress protein [Parvularculaceae bacterium]